MRMTPKARLACLLLAAGVLAHAIVAGRAFGVTAATLVLAVQGWWWIRTRVPIRTGATSRLPLRIGSGGVRHG